MNKVYVVMDDVEEGGEIRSVFSTREKAEEYIKDCLDSDDVLIQEWEVDQWPAETR